jgi:hypothetical protein
LEERIASIFRIEKSMSEDVHGATSQKTTFFTVTAMKTSNLTYSYIIPKYV